jgi:hypothetical protein
MVRQLPTRDPLERVALGDAIRKAGACGSGLSLFNQLNGYMISLRCSMPAKIAFHTDGVISCPTSRLRC